MQYEILYLVGEPDTAELQNLQKKVEDIITESGAKLLDEKWEDRRKLAYPIKHIVRGTFTAQRFEIPESASGNPVKNIQSKLRLMKEVLRCMIVRSEELPTLKEFSTRKEEERLKHSQGNKKTQDAPRKIKDSAKPISSQPFTQEDTKENTGNSSEDTPEKSETPQVKDQEETPKPQEKVSEKVGKKETSENTPSPTPKNKDAKDIDEKLDEILNM